VTPRLVIDIGDLAEVQLAVTHASLQDGTVLNNGVVNIDVGSGAQVEFCHTQALSQAAYHVCTTRIRQQQDSALHALDVATGAALSRHDLSVSLEGPGSSVVLDGIMAARQRQVLDAHTTIEHMHPHCKSRQLYKSILDDRSSTVFNGLVRAHPGAMGTDGEQMNRNLLLSTKARANTKPELQIANDDVRCTHGATVGQISEQELFYLESRGIEPSMAREMLARGFVEEVLYRLDDTRRHADLHALLDRYFEQTGHRGAQG
jgi:Fe-S cluster assembly protein SufD